jgi:transcriptional regulator with XRE-family HTH domain
MDLGKRFLWLQERYRKPDGSRWTNADIERATGGFVRGNYLTNLIHGRIHQPGTDRLQAVAQVMGFPMELWFRKETSRELLGEPPAPTLVGKLNALFKKVPNRATGESFTSAEVSRLTYGKLSEELLEAARAGEVEDLSGAQYVALSNVFGVDVSYWYTDPDGLPPLEGDWLSAARTKKGRAVLNKFHNRSEEEKDMILFLLDRLAERDEDRL